MVARAVTGAVAKVEGEKAAPAGKAARGREVAQDAAATAAVGKVGAMLAVLLLVAAMVAEARAA